MTAGTRSSISFNPQHPEVAYQAVCETCAVRRNAGHRAAEFEAGAASNGTRAGASICGATVHDPEQTASEHDRLCGLNRSQLDFSMASWILEISDRAGE